MDILSLSSPYVIVSSRPATEILRRTCIHPLTIRIVKRIIEKKFKNRVRLFRYLFDLISIKKRDRKSKDHINKRYLCRIAMDNCSKAWKICPYEKNVNKERVVINDAFWASLIKKYRKYQIEIAKKIEKAIRIITLLKSASWVKLWKVKKRMG